MYQRPTRFNLLPDVIKNLLIINGLFFMATLVFGDVLGFNLIRNLGVYIPNSPEFKPYQIVTHMFMHGSFGHILMNMFVLWMFGYTLENIWGSKRFLIYYLLTGLGAAALHLGVSYWQFQSLAQELNAGQLTRIINDGFSVLQSNMNYSDPTMAQANRLLHAPTVGASGAVFGVLLAFGMMFPNQYIYLYFLLPIKAKYFVAGLGAIQLFNGIAYGQGSGVAYLAHLGGMIFGYLLLRYWRKNDSNYHF